MGKLVGKSGPFMHFPEKVRHLDQRIHFRDFGVESFRRGGNVACMWRHDQCAVFHSDAIELPETGSPSQPFEVDIHHLANFREPSRTVARDTEAEFIFLLQGDKGRLRHEMFVYRPE